MYRTPSVYGTSLNEFAAIKEHKSRYLLLNVYVLTSFVQVLYVFRKKTRLLPPHLFAFMHKSESGKCSITLNDLLFRSVCIFQLLWEQLCVIKV
jgi:hypothetical protein